MSREAFERRVEFLPEPKLELLDGRLTVGNGAGNLQVLQDLVEGWGAEAALPMAPAEMWWEALRQAFREFAPPGIGKSASVWQAWAAQLSYSPRLPSAGPMLHGKHSAVRQALMFGLFGFTRERAFAEVSGRDVARHS